MKPISYFRAVRQKRIHGDIKEIRHFHDKPQFGQGGPGFALIDRTDGYPQHFRQLFLGQFAVSGKPGYFPRCLFPCHPLPFWLFKYYMTEAGNGKEISNIIIWVNAHTNSMSRIDPTWNLKRNV